MINIKVSGVTAVKQLQQLDGLNIGFADLNFIPGSPDYAEDKLSDSLSGQDLDIRKVGIFSDAGYEAIMAKAEKYELDIVQLNGEESPDVCADLSDELEVIKTFRVSADIDSVDELVKEYDDVCDYYLFECSKKDWAKIREAKIEKPFFLSGDIGPEDVATIKKFKHPDLYGITTGVLFQKEPGIPDMSLVLKFIHELKKTS